jgi:hypothetical protein
MTQKALKHELAWRDMADVAKVRTIEADHAKVQAKVRGGGAGGAGCKGGGRWGRIRAACGGGRDGGTHEWGLAAGWGVCVCVCWGGGGGVLPCGPNARPRSGLRSMHVRTNVCACACMCAGGA